MAEYMYLWRNRRSEYVRGHVSDTVFFYTVESAEGRTCDEFGPVRRSWGRWNITTLDDYATCRFEVVFTWSRASSPVTAADYAEVPVEETK